MIETPHTVDSRELYRRHFQATRSDEYGEEHFQEAVERVLDENGVDYVSEFVLEQTTDSTQPGRGRRVDIYIPETDTAIELKIEASLRGLGQCALYASHHSESLLLVRSGKSEIRHAIQQREDIHYAVCTPGITKKPARFDFAEASSVADFMDEYSDISVVNVPREEATDG